MKKKLTSTITSLCLTLSILAVVPNNANASIILTGKNLSATRGMLAGGLCMLFSTIVFPIGAICVLDEKSDNNNSASIADLAANGYSDQEIQSILNDQSALAEVLTAKKAQIKIGKEDTVESITSEIQSLLPNVSQTYVNYVISSSGLK